METNIRYYYLGTLIAVLFVEDMVFYYCPTEDMNWKMYDFLREFIMHFEGTTQVVETSQMLEDLLEKLY
jgi:hypothetical protein